MGEIMKYNEVIYQFDGKNKNVRIKDYGVEELENMAMEGQFLCPGKNCKAKLCLVHSSKNGGRTCFLKAVDDENHSPECEYKIINYKERHISVRSDGIFTEKQVNDAVRRIYNDYINPINTGEKRDRKVKSTGKSTKSDTDKEHKTNVTASGGKIVYGDETAEGIAGRMRRRYTVTNSDVGIMTTICGKAKKIFFDHHNDMIVQFNDERLSNIQVFVGSIYEHNNPSEFKNLYLLKEYFDKESKNKEIIVAAGGLVNSINGKLVLELQANGSLRVDNQTIMKMVFLKTKKHFEEGIK